MGNAKQDLSPWPVRITIGLTLFLLSSGLVFLFLPKQADLFLGMLNPGSDPARIQLVGIRQFQYGLLLGTMLWMRQRSALSTVVGLGGLIPLADSYVAWSQSGWQPALPHLLAAIGAMILAWSLRLEKFE